MTQATNESWRKVLEHWKVCETCKGQPVPEVAQRRASCRTYLALSAEHLASVNVYIEDTEEQAAQRREEAEAKRAAAAAAKKEMA